MPTGIAPAVGRAGRRRPAATWLFLVILGLLGTGLGFADPEPSEPSPAERQAHAIEALRDFNALIGSWRGIGSVRRYSNVGAWQESAEWIWEIRPDDAAIEWTIDGGKQFETALLGYDPDKKRFQLVAQLAAGGSRTYTGTQEEKRLVMESAPDADGLVQRVTIHRLREDRTIVLFEERAEKQTVFRRVAEVAYQREGTKLAEAKEQGPLCIVTGGKGTISVSHGGKTYYVCCSGCRSAFQDDPEGVLAQAALKKSEKSSSTP